MDQNQNSQVVNPNLNPGEIKSDTELSSLKNETGKQEIPNQDNEGSNQLLNQNTNFSSNEQNGKNYQSQSNDQNPTQELNQIQPNINNQSIVINTQSKSNEPNQFNSNDQTNLQNPENISQGQSNLQNEPEKSQKKEDNQNQDVNSQGKEIQSQPVIENKIVFIHPMNNYSSIEKIDEIEKCSSIDLFQVVNKRIENVNLKIQDILKSHEKYTLFLIYYKLINNFNSNLFIGKDPKRVFILKDTKKRMKITDFEFNEALNELNCNLSSDELNLILRSLTQKINNLYSYEEFLNNVYNVQKNENGQLVEIFKQCNFYFNDYIYSFRHYIQDNKIDYVNTFTTLFRDMTQITIEFFKKFLDEIGFRLGHENEKKYLFSALCDNNYSFDKIIIRDDSNIFQRTLFYIADLKDISEENFLTFGKVSVEGVKSNNDWIKNIQNYTEEVKQIYKSQYKSFEKNFRSIHENCLKYSIQDLTMYFAKSGEDISPDGDIDIEVFKKLMNNIGISYNISFDTLINQFRDKKRKEKNFLKLTDFLSIYNLFLDDDNDNDNNNKKNIFEEEKNINPTEIKPNKVIDNYNYVFKNAHRQFTEEDIDVISEICEGIADIIINELHDSVSNFFQKKDKQNGFFFVEEFKDILLNDLEIKTEGNGQEIEDIKMFIDFVSSDKMVQGSDIINIKYLIKVIKNYSGKDGPPPINNNNINNNIGDINVILNKKGNIDNIENIKEESKTLRGQKNQNINPNDEEINTSSNIIDNNNSKKEVKTEIINTDLKPKPSSRSFDEIISDFAFHLSSKRKRFNEIFPSINLEEIQNNQTITDEELKRGFKKSKFPITEKEFSVLMSQFDSNNQKQILVEDFKHEISKHQPKYFREKYQFKVPELKSKDFVPQGNYNTNKPYLLNGMHKIQTFLDKEKISTENFFLAVFSSSKRLKTTPINRDTWKERLIVTNKNYSDIVPGLLAIEVDSIYTEMESRYPNSIILSNIIEFFNGYSKKTENDINYNDDSPLNETIKNEMQLLFDSFDNEKTGKISFNDFYKCLKSVDHKATIKDAEEILGEHTNQNTSTVDRGTFNEIIYNYIKKLLIIQREEKDFIKNLFREADIDKNGFLTKNQVKYLMKNKINCSLTDPELDEILNKVDIYNENEIDIRDFIDLLDNINKNQKIEDNIINTSSNTEFNDNETIPIMNLNLNLNMYRKIRPKDFISLYSELPISFLPSFTREEQQKNNLLPSSCLKPQTKDYDNFFYKDIFPTYESKEITNNFGVKETKVYKTLNKKRSFINCKICFDDYATGVSSPDENLFESPNSQFKVVGRLLKISLFNDYYKNFVGNSVSIDCIYKKEYQDRWYFEDDDFKFNNNIIIRYDEHDYSQIKVIFEFVLVIQKRVEQKLYTIEASCGWSEIPLTRLKNSIKERLKIKGGSPMGESYINLKDIRKKRTGFIPKLATLFEGVIESECPIIVKPFEDLSKNEQSLIDYLPTKIICHSAAMQMISIYRQELAKYIFNHKDYLIKPIKEEYYLTNMFCRIADVPDAFRVMNEIWKEIVIDGATSEERNNKDYLRENFKIFVEKINGVLYIDKFKYNPLDPTELPRGDIKLMQDRDILLNSVLRYGQDRKFNKLDYKMENYSFKPFTMDEINGKNKISIMDKIDEIITLAQE